MLLNCVLDSAGSREPIIFFGIFILHGDAIFLKENVMEQIALLFESSAENPNVVDSVWYNEWSAAKEFSQFDVHLFNYEAYLNGEELICDIAPKHDMPTFLRCHPTSKENYKRLEHDLLSLGYRLLTDSWRVLGPKERGLGGYSFVGDYEIENINVGACFGSSGHGSYPPTVYVVRDADGPLSDLNESLAIGYFSGDEGKELAKKFEKAKGTHFTGGAFFEEYVTKATCNEIPVTWRVFYFEGKTFFKSPLEPDALTICPNLPKPSKKLIGAFQDVTWNLFYACDFILLKEGIWKCYRLFDGQMSQVPIGEDVEKFYTILARCIKKAPQIPEWVWCLTAEVRDENKIGKDKRIVHGTRHFSPGTKVFLHPPNWDERVAAIGIPRYTDKYIRVVMDVRKLEHFALEKVSNPEIVTALQNPGNIWMFTHMAPTSVGRGYWDQSEESRQQIQDEINWLSHLDPDGKRWS